MNLKSYRKSLLENNSFLIFGQEDYFISYAADVLKTKLIRDFADFNYTEADQKSVSFNDFHAILESVPMMDTARVVHLKNLQFAQSASNPWPKEDLEALKEAVRNLDPSVNLMISSTSVEVKKDGDSKKNSYPKLLTELSAIMTPFPLGSLSAGEFEQYINDAVAERSENSIKLDRALLRYYMELSGYLFKDNARTIRDINNDIEKLVSYIREKGSISSQEMETLFIREFDSDVFKLIDCIVKNQKSTAFGIYSNLTKKGEPAIKIVATVGSSLSTMIKASYYVEKGYTQAMAAQAMGKHPFAVKSGLENLKRIGRKKAIRCLESLIRTDYDFKTGRLSENVYGEMALSRIFSVISESESKN